MKMLTFLGFYRHKRGFLISDPDHTYTRTSPNGKREGGRGSQKAPGVLRRIFSKNDLLFGSRCVALVLSKRIGRLPPSAIVRQHTLATSKETEGVRLRSFAPTSQKCCSYFSEVRPFRKNVFLCRRDAFSTPLRSFADSSQKFRP